MAISELIVSGHWHFWIVLNVEISASCFTDVFFVWLDVSVCCDLCIGELNSFSNIPLSNVASVLSGT